MNQDVVRQTLDAIMKSQKAPIADPRLAGLTGYPGLAKDANSTFSQSASAISGLTFYDLELGAKFLYPVLTPLRNEIPRVSGKGGIQANWRAVVAINGTGNGSVGVTQRIGVSGGNRGGLIKVQTQDFIAAYKGIGLEDNVDFEAQYAGQGFDDIRGIAAKTLLESVMLGEEAVILGGNNSFPLGTTPLPALGTASTGGTFSNGTYFVTAVALAFDAVLNGSVSATGVQGQITRTNPDSSVDTFGGGAAAVSAEAQITLSGGTSTQTITATVTAVPGAAGYAWFESNTTGQERIVAITANNTVTITAPPAGTNQLSSSLGSNDNSTNNLVFTGLIYQALTAGSNAYTKNVGGTLTSDSATGIVEIDTALKDRWDTYRLGPDTMWVNSQQAYDISKKILANGSSGAQRFVFNTVQDALNAGVMVRTYLNRFSMAGGQTIDIKIHPNMPAGMILMTTKKLPYPLSNVGNVIQIRTRQDYYQIEWPLRSRKYEYGVYADEVLQHYFPPSMILLYNITAG